MIPGETLVRLADGSCLPMQDITHGTMLYTDDGPAAVEGLILQPNAHHCIRTPSGIELSNWQPFFWNGVWRFPLEVFFYQAAFVPAQPDRRFYDILLAEGKSHFYVVAHAQDVSQDLKCTALAHGLSSDACDHPYFKSQQCRTDLQTIFNNVSKKLSLVVRHGVEMKTTMQTV